MIHVFILLLAKKILSGMLLNLFITWKESPVICLSYYPDKQCRWQKGEEVFLHDPNAKMDTLSDPDILLLKTVIFLYMG